MTVASTATKTIVLGPGGGPFSYNFMIPTTSDVTVIYTNTSGIETILSTSQYTITGIGTGSGTVTLTGSPLIAGETLTILRDIATLQLTSLQNQGASYPAVVETALDRLTMIVQQDEEIIGRNLTVAASDTTPALLPTATARALKVLGFDANGDPIAVSAAPAGTISSAMAPVCASATVSAAYALLRGGVTTIQVNEGGTGATTATAARTNLGAQSSLPVYLASDYGVLTANTAAANTTALNALITTLNASPGGRIIFGKGLYQFNTLTAITGNNIVLVGQGNHNSGTMLFVYEATGDFISFTGAEYSGIENIRINAGVRRTSGDGVSINNGCYMCYLYRVTFYYQYTCLRVTRSTDTRIDHVHMRYCFGFCGFKFDGIVSQPSYRCVVTDILADNPYPISPSALPESWVTLTAYSLGDIVDANGNIYQCTTAGITGASAPAGIPGTGTADAFSTEISDGSVKWKFVCANDLAWMLFDSYAYSLILHAANFIDGVYGVYMSDSAATGTSYPSWLEAVDLELDHNLHGMVLNRGLGVQVSNSQFISAMVGHGIDIQTTFKGEVILTGNRILGNALHGVRIGVGPILVNVSNNHILNNSQAGSGTYHGISVDVAAKQFSINSNQCSADASGGGNLQGYGILVNTGASDYYTVVNNICYDNVTGGTSDGGTGINKTVSGNV